MKTSYLTRLLVCLICFLPLHACGQNDAKEQRPTDNVTPVALGDPFILYHQGLYYAYGTQSPDGIVVFTSEDMIHWSVPILEHGQLALYKNDVWGERWFWAPEVYSVNGKFYMYFSADEHICVATSNSPLGPFIQDNKAPIREEKSIDNSLFIDDDGKAYMYFVRFNDGNNIWVAEMTDDLQGIKSETLAHCFSVSQRWEEVQARVNEGPFVIKHKGLYYMTYSANHFESQKYGVGYATAESPMGPWSKYEHNPILQSPGELVGAGHSALFYNEEGELFKVFHAHRDIQNIHPRKMYISKVSFKANNAGADIMEIDTEYLIPVLKK